MFKTLVQNRWCIFQPLELGGGWGFRDCWIYIVKFGVVDLSLLFKICPHTWISHLFRLKNLVLANLCSYICPCHSSVSWLPRWRQSWVVDVFHVGYKFNNFSVDDTTWTQNNLHKFGKHSPPLHCSWQWNIFTIWMRLVYLLSSTNNT